MLDYVHPNASTIPAWAADYIGTPFAEQGLTREGCDCFGLLSLIYAERSPYGPLPPYRGHHWFEGQKAKLVAPDAAAYISGFEEVPLATARLFDGLMLRVRGLPIHVAMVLAPGWMIHTTEDVGVCIERYDGPLWVRRVISCHRRG